MTNIFILFALVLVGFASAQVPIPNRPDGWGVGGPADAHVVIEMFLDPLCPDCKATWPILQQVVKAYGSRIHFRFHTFPLPYHTNSFLVSQSIHVVANYTDRNTEAIFAYTTNLYDNQDKWYNGATLNLTMPQVADSLATFAASTGIIPKDKLLAGLASDDLNFETRVSWKYTCSRGATGTPTFLINGVAVGADDTWTLKDWQSVIDPILGSNEQQTSEVADCPAGQKPCNYLPGKTACCLAGENCIPNVGCRCLDSQKPKVADCPAGQKPCNYLPGKTACCLAGENCIPNVGCRCLDSQKPKVADCPAGQKPCNYLPGKTACCLAGENCIPNVGCRCFNLKNGNKCF